MTLLLLPRLNALPRCSHARLLQGASRMAALLSSSAASSLPVSSSSTFRWFASLSASSHPAPSPPAPVDATHPTPLVAQMKLGSSVFRSHKCAHIDESLKGRQVMISGWLSAKRVYADTVFLRIRDISGSVQVVANSSHPDFAALRQLIIAIPKESVVSVSGQVLERPLEAKTAESAIEVVASSVTLLNEASLAPFSLDPKNPVSEETRQEFRFLDLRRPEMQKNILTRALVNQIVRMRLWDLGFTEVETPTLFKRTPEGAREFLVPTRNEGLFYALPQSPQQYKQMIMVGGLDRYYQFARCYRDEDLRADRQPEFTQIDLEMSFVSPLDIQNVIEHLLCSIWETVKGIRLQTPFRRMKYEHAMEKFGVDKPDTRFSMHIADLTPFFKDGRFVASHEQTHGFKFSMQADVAHEFLKKYEKLVGLLPKTHKVSLFEVGEEAVKRRSVRMLPSDYLKDSELSPALGDYVLTVAGPKAKILHTLGKLRLQVASVLEECGQQVRDASRFDFLWVEDFPLFTESETQEGLLETTHHPFTAPHPDDAHLLFTSPEKVRGLHYDIVVNGWELGGGSIRIHDAAVQTRVIEDILKADPNKFSHLLKALRTGAPPHGGIALGFDRLMAILLGTKSIRDVIAFPKSFSGKDLTCDSPSPISDKELKEYGLQLAPKN